MYILWFIKLNHNIYKVSRRDFLSHRPPKVSNLLNTKVRSLRPGDQSEHIWALCPAMGSHGH